MSKLKLLLTIGGSLCIAGFLLRAAHLKLDGKLIRSHSRKAVPYYV